MTMIRVLALIALLGVAALSLADAPVPGRVDDLAWMTGSWAGPLGSGQTLEEHWIEPAGGSIAALVRNTGNGATSMVELIVIEEQDNTLVLRLQQWNPGFEPRSPEPNEMVLAEVEHNRVRFESPDATGAFKSLGYARPDAESFNIDIETHSGQKFQIRLKPR